MATLIELFVGICIVFVIAKIDCFIHLCFVFCHVYHTIIFIGIHFIMISLIYLLIVQFPLLINLLICLVLFGLFDDRWDLWVDY